MLFYNLLSYCILDIILCQHKWSYIFLMATVFPCKNVPQLSELFLYCYTVGSFTTFYHCKQCFDVHMIVYTCLNIYIYIYLINLFLAAWGLRCCVRAFSSCSERGLLFVVVHGLLIVVASLVAEHGLQARGLQQLWHEGSVVVARGLQSAGSVVVAHELSCSAACAIFLDQGSNLCSLDWQADS